MANQVPTQEQIDTAAQVIDKAKADAELSDVYGLVPVRAYVRDEVKAKAAKALSQAAKRQAKFAEKKAAEGKVKEWVPKELVASLKAHDGDYVAWLKWLRSTSSLPFVEDQSRTTAAPPFSAAVPAEKAIEVRSVLSDEEQTWLETGRRVSTLPAWKRWVIARWIK